MSNDFFSDLLASISERGRTLLRLGPASVDPKQNAIDMIDRWAPVLHGSGKGDHRR